MCCYAPQKITLTRRQHEPTKVPGADYREVRRLGSVPASLVAGRLGSTQAAVSTDAEGVPTIAPIRGVLRNHRAQNLALSRTVER